MIHNRHAFLLKLVSHLCLVVFAVSTLAQSSSEKKLQIRSNEKQRTKISEADLPESQRRAFGISIVTSLADEARKYNDRALRPRVLARAADTLWDADRDTARTLFRRAWEDAESGDADELTLKTSDGVPPMAKEMVAGLRRRSGYDLRAEVLALAARRDRTLAEEFLSREKRGINGEQTGLPNASTSQNQSENSEVTRRLNVAGRLLDEGEYGRALELATPALNQVNAGSINFLSKLREKKSEAADQRFAVLLARAEFDTSSDANTVSGLSSYVFTPGFYVTFNKDGSARWTQPEQSATPLNRPNLPATILSRFFQVAATILLRPSPLPDQDFTSSGRIGKYMVIKRLLPLFEQHAADTATALRSQLGALMNDGPSGGMTDDTPLLRQGLETEETAGSLLERMQYRLDHATTSRERDLIYADAAAMLASQGDSRAQNFAQKIDDSGRRAQVNRYVDFELVRFALREKKTAEAIRLAASGQLSHPQRAWAYLQSARQLMDSEGQRALELLEEGANEARRIDPEDPDRARLLIGVATQLSTGDPVRAWEIMDEVIKAANNSQKFSGEGVELHFAFATKSGLKITSVGGADFGLSGVLRALAKKDLYRAIDVAKGFKNDAPRSVAVLAIATSVLEKIER